MKKTIQAIVASTMAGLLPASSFARDYTVQKGDTLSYISGKHVSKPVYGPNGSLKRVIDLNTETVANPDVIEPGQIIVLPGPGSDSASPVAQASEVSPAQPVPQAEPIPAAPIEESEYVQPRRDKITLSAMSFDTRIESRDRSGAYAT